MENTYTPAVNSPTRGSALLDVCIVRSEIAFTSSSNIQGISDHYGVLLEVEWVANCRERQVELLFLISNFRRVLNPNVCILLGISPVSD